MFCVNTRVIIFTLKNIILLGVHKTHVALKVSRSPLRSPTPYCKTRLLSRPHTSVLSASGLFSPCTTPPVLSCPQYLPHCPGLLFLFLGPVSTLATAMDRRYVGSLDWQCLGTCWRGQFLGPILTYGVRKWDGVQCCVSE